MNEDISLIAATDQTRISDKYNYELDLEVKKLLKTSYQRVKILLVNN